MNGSVIFTDPKDRDVMSVVVRDLLVVKANDFPCSRWKLPSTDADLSIMVVVDGVLVPSKSCQRVLLVRHPIGEVSKPCFAAIGKG